MKWQKKLLVLVACLCSFCACGLFGTKNANATSVNNIINFQTNWFANRETTHRLTNRSGAIPLDFLSTQTTYDAIRVNNFAFSFYNPEGTSSGKFYNARIVFDIVGDYQHYHSGTGSSLGGNIRFEQGIVSNATDSVSYQSINSTTTRYTVSSQVSLENATSLDTLVVFLEGNGNYLLSCSNYSGAMTQPCSKPYTATLMNVVDFEVNVSNDPSIALLQQQIQQNQTIINQNQQQIDQENEDRDNIEQTGEDAEQAGEDASENASATGQTLMQAFTSLITALTSIHQTNCNLPNFSLYGLNFNNMNMCMFDVPTGLMNLASIGMVFIIVPLGINLVKRMIALYNEIVGGGK